MNEQKVGLCLAYTGTNYGQLLQAYATQEAIKKKGFQTEIIRYHSGKRKGIKWSYGAVVVAGKQIICELKQRIKQTGKFPLDELHQRNIIERQKVSDQFRRDRMNNIVVCNGINELRRQSGEYFAVLVGSDQVWLPDVAVSNFYTLRFAAPGIRRISYATSLGVSDYPNYAKKAAGDFWKQIDYLSVREQQGKRIIQSIVDIPVQVVADPTYLFTKEEWEGLIPPRKVIEDGYLLCYFLGDSEPIKKYASCLARKKGLRLVSILSDECQSNDSLFADEVLIGKTPEDFVNLIRNAEYVLTDSFHGVAFSVINQKQFNVFYRRRNAVKESRNSRIDNIVRMWGVEERLIREPENLEIQDADIDYQEVSRRVNDLRITSLKFLDEALLG